MERQQAGKGYVAWAITARFECLSVLLLDRVEMGTDAAPDRRSLGRPDNMEH